MLGVEDPSFLRMTISKSFVFIRLAGLAGKATLLKINSTKKSKSSATFLTPPASNLKTKLKQPS